MILLKFIDRDLMTPMLKGRSALAVAGLATAAGQHINK